MVFLRQFAFWAISLISFVASLMTTFHIACFLSSQVAGSVLSLNEADKIEKFLYPALWNSFLMGLFVLQHSGMALQTWNELLAVLRLSIISRSVYVLTTCFVLEVIVNYWKPLPSSAAIWLVDTSERPGLWLFFFLLHVMLWTCILLSTLLMDHLDIVGLKQVYYDYHGLNEPTSYKTYEEQKLMNHMRHPGATCLLIILWIHPAMTLQRCFLAIAWTIYLLLGFSVNYRDYHFVKHQVANKRVLIREVHIDKLN